MADEILTRQELAAYLKVVVRTIDRLRKEGMPYIRVADKAIRFNKEEVLEWLKQRAKK